MKKEKSRIKMKKLLSLSLVVILLLSLPLPALSANENQKSVNNDASMVFVLGATGSYSTALGEVVDGKRSVVGRYKGTDSYNQIMFTNPDILPLQPNTTYTVTFKYRILETPDRGFELLFFSDKGASLNDWVESSLEFKGKKGDQGKLTLTATLKKYDDYRLLFNIIGQGAIAIDSVSLAKKGSAVPIAEADFEIHDVVSFGGIDYNFPNVRTDYIFKITDKGTAVINRATGKSVVVPFGEKMTFAGILKYSKDTNYIIHHVRSHMEDHGDWRILTKMPVDWLQPLEMENIGTGNTDRMLGFKNNDDKITKENFVILFKFAIEAGSTPYLTTIFMFDNYNMFPRYSRILPDAPPFTDTPYNDYVIGSDKSDTFSTGAGNDLAYGGPGNDEIYGGSGFDEAYYTWKRADYDVVTEKGITTVTARTGNEGKDILIGFEGLIFSDTAEKIPAYDISFSDIPETAWFYRPVSYITARGISAGPASKNFRPNDKLTRGDFLVMLMKAYGIEPDEDPADNFSDAGNTYYTGYLAAAKRLGLTSGIGNNKYGPDNQITRQELFTLLYRVLKEIDKLPQGNSGSKLADFTDGDQVAPYAEEAMTLLVETGTISGSGGRLNPKNTTTRAEMAQVLYNLLSK